MLDKEFGRRSWALPMCAGIFVTDHLRPAALAAGIEIAEGQRFGLHSLRSSMAIWMVSIDKTDVKTAQGNMRHAGPEIMLHRTFDPCLKRAIRSYYVLCFSVS